MKTPLGRHGFSLVEMTLMIAVGAVLITGISRAAQTQIERSVDLRNYAIACHLADRQMAIMYNSAYPEDGTTTPDSDDDFPDFTLSQAVSTLATSDADTIKSITVTVSIGSHQLVQLITYRSNIITFGDGI